VRVTAASRSRCENRVVFDHVTVRVSDHHASRSFYETVLSALDHRVSVSGGHFHEWNDFGIAQTREDRPLTRHLHVAFVARSRADVEAFWRAGTKAGYASDGEPGLRPRYHEAYYGAFLLDPDGNGIEAVYHGRGREGDNVIDHLWIRVADLEASKRFYETIAPVLGLRMANVLPERFHVAAHDRSFALVRGEASENVHLAFPVGDKATVREFHRIALAAGYRDNGGPDDRRYHTEYYGAFVLDPDGNNVEAVHGGMQTRWSTK
jgi:catechol 2,3-dioxygenase-like lactoylglutathione lyase family enzyme